MAEYRYESPPKKWNGPSIPSLRGAGRHPKAMLVILTTN